MSLDLLIDLADLDLDSAQLRSLQAISRLVRREGDRIMATLDDIKTLETTLGADAAAAAARVTASLDEAKSQISDLQAQVAALIAAGGNPDDLQAIADGLTSIDTTITGIDPDAAPAG